MSHGKYALMNGIAAGIGVAVVAVACGVGCYKPQVQPGGLHCATAPDKACPDGYLCANDVCVSAGSVAQSGSGGTTGTGGKPGTGGTQPGTGGTPGSGGGVGTGGSPGPRLVGQSCTIINRGQPTQTGDCEPSAECVDDCAGSRCYRLCATDADCLGSSCTRAVGTPARAICEVPYSACDPQAKQGCAASDGCYLLSADLSSEGADRTVCDCSMNALAPGEPCTDSRECAVGVVGQVCPPTGMPGGGACRRICDPTAAVSGCALATCHPFGSRWGYCN